MIQPAIDTYLYRFGRTSYIRNTLLALLFLAGFLASAIISFTLSRQFIPTYSHAFTPYLKWQDVLVVLLWYITGIALWGSILIVRFLYALYVGYHKDMLTIEGSNALTVRDLSHENLMSIFWLVGTAFSCFVVALLGLVPEMLPGWTLSLPHPLYSLLGTGLAILLSLAGLAITLPALSFVVIGLVGSISFCRHIGSAQTYRLTSQASLAIDGFALTIMYPDAPQSVIDLNLLDPADLRHLLCLLRQRWIEAHQMWNPDLGAEIEAALEAAEDVVLG